MLKYFMGLLIAYQNHHDFIRRTIRRRAYEACYRTRPGHCWMILIHIE